MAYVLGQIVQDYRDHDPGPRNAGLAVTDVWIDGNPMAPVHSNVPGRERIVEKEKSIIRSTATQVKCNIGRNYRMSAGAANTRPSSAVRELLFLNAHVESCGTPKSKANTEADS